MKFVFWFFTILGCARATPPSPAADSSADRASSLVPDAAPARACDTTMPCQVFTTPLEAWKAVLDVAPRVLAIGETHAQKSLQVPSAAKRFMGEFLPTLEGRASDLVLELWVGSGACGKQERQVAAQQRDVTQTQADTNPSEFVLLGEAAKARNIEPHVLVPTCDEYARILDAGAGDVDAMLSMIARLTARQLEKLLARPGNKMIVAYGGAMHNDATPRAGREEWSFAPAVLEKAGGSYLELDLIVPELVKDTDAWRAQPWYAHYRPGAHHGETLLFTTGPKSYALVFPRSGP